jgi:hypothetical protein
MITIKNTKPTKEGKKQYSVIYSGDNNEVLSTATKLNSKQACFKNIFAMSKLFVTITGTAYNRMIWDRTTKNSKPLMVDLFTKVKKTTKQLK